MKHVFHIEYDDETKQMDVQGPQDPLIALGMLSRVQLIMGEQMRPAEEKSKSGIVIPQVQIPQIVP